MKKTKKNKSRNRRILEWSLAIVLDIMLIVGVWQGYRLFEQNFVSKDGEEHLIYIYPETTVDALVQQLEQDYRIASPFCLRLHAKLMKWPGERQYARTGCYRMPVRSGNLQGVVEKDFYGEPLSPYVLPWGSKPTVPTDEEVERNPRARSAKLRVAQKRERTERRGEA